MKESMAMVGDDAPEMRGGGDVDAGWVVYKSKLIEVLGLEKVAPFGGENAEAPADAVFGNLGRQADQQRSLRHRT